MAWINSQLRKQPGVPLVKVGVHSLDRLVEGSVYVPADLARSCIGVPAVKVGVHSLGVLSIYVRPKSLDQLQAEEAAWSTFSRYISKSSPNYLIFESNI